MGLERKIEYFGIASILLFGAVLGGSLTYTHLDSRMDSLQDQVDSVESGKNVVYINTTGQNSLVHLFDQVDQSVVSVNTFGAENSQGSGFVYSRNGYIVTNEHVIDGANRVQVTFTDGSTVNAEIVGQDRFSDIAVLKVNKKGLQPLELANSSEVRVGQTAVAIGNPFGLRSSMTSGIISQKGRLLPVAGGFSIPNVLQTDAAINPGNSGGPLVNVRGEVVGINTAIETRTGTFSGIGFAIPANTVERVADGIIETGGYETPWIGVSGINMDEDIAEEMGVNQTSGFLVVEVVEDGPAADSGLRAGNRTVTINGMELNVGGDIIVAINGEEVRGITDILNYLATETDVGETVDITVIRDGERQDIQLTLGARPRENQTS